MGAGFFGAGVGDALPPEPSAWPSASLPGREGVRLTSGPKTAIKRTLKEPTRTKDPSRFRHGAGAGGAAGPDRGARREAETGPGERGRRGDRPLARRRARSGTGARGGRSRGYRLRGDGGRAPARAGAVVRGRRRPVPTPSSSGVRRSRPRPAPSRDGPGGPRGGRARGGGNRVARTRPRRGGRRDGREGALRARPPASARGRVRRRARLRAPCRGG